MLSKQCTLQSEKIFSYFDDALRTTESDIKEIELQPDGSFEPIQIELAAGDSVDVVVEIDDDDLEGRANSISPEHDVSFPDYSIYMFA